MGIRPEEGNREPQDQEREDARSSPDIHERGNRAEGPRDRNEFEEGLDARPSEEAAVDLAGALEIR